MRVLILSCNTGEGHNSSARAIRQVLESGGDECVVKDALLYCSVAKSKLISHGHVFVYRNLPKIFGMSYRHEERKPVKIGRDSFMYELFKNGADGLRRDIEEGGYDAVICVHVFAAIMVTELRRRGVGGFRAYFLATDYTCTPGASYVDVDAFFIPHESLVPEFERNGIPKDKLVVTGIPVRREFFERMPADVAKRELGLAGADKVVLLMSGSMGCGPIKSLTYKLSRKMPKGTELVVICGNNARLCKQLLKRYRTGNVKIVGFTREIGKYLDAASLVLTKPGGLSSTEAWAKGCPMLLMEAVPGCETRNIEFYTNSSLADAANGLDSDEIANTVCAVISNDAELELRRRRMKENAPPDSAAEICRYIREDVQNQESAEICELSGFQVK